MLTFGHTYSRWCGQARYTLHWLMFFWSIVYKHWPDTRAFITRNVELWNRWIRLSCYYSI